MSYSSTRQLWVTLGRRIIPTWKMHRRSVLCITHNLQKHLPVFTDPTRHGHGVGAFALTRSNVLISGFNSLVEQSGMRNSQGLWNDGLNMTSCQNNGAVRCPAFFFPTVPDIVDRLRGHTIRYTQVVVEILRRLMC